MFLSQICGSTFGQGSGCSSSKRLARPPRSFRPGENDLIAWLHKQNTMVMYTYTCFHLCTCIYIYWCVNTYIVYKFLHVCLYSMYALYIYCKNTLCSICLYTVYRYHVHACINIYIYQWIQSISWYKYVLIYIYITYICKLYIYRTRAPVRAICFLSVFQEQLVENTCLKHGNGQQISNPWLTAGSDT